MNLTTAQLRAVMRTLSEERAATWTPHLNAAMTEFKIVTPAHVSMWLANVAHETRELSALVESMRYSAKRMVEVWPSRFGRQKGATAAQRAEGDRRAESLAFKPVELALYVYGGRNDLGNRPGTFDGFAYIGRSAGHLTGRDVYQRCGVALGLPLLENPSLLEQPSIACRAAGWFWQSKPGLAAAADREDDVAGCRLWNGGLNGLAERRAYRLRAKAALAA